MQKWASPYLFPILFPFLTFLFFPFFPFYFAFVFFQILHFFAFWFCHFFCKLKNKISFVSHFCFFHIRFLLSPFFSSLSVEHKTCAYSRAETLTISKLNCLHDHAEKHRQWCCDVVHTGENHLETLRLLGSRLKDAQGVRRFFPLNHS